MTVQSSAIRHKVEPRDVPPTKAARRLHLTLADFRRRLPELMTRGFPPADPTTGMFDLKAIEAWMDARSGLTQERETRDASAEIDRRLENIRWDA